MQLYEKKLKIKKKKNSQ